MSPRGQVLTLLGAQPGTATSSLAFLIGRSLAGQSQKSCAFIDPSSSRPAFFPLHGSAGSENRSFRQLRPYLDQLDEKTMDRFFATTPEGLKYVPLDNGPSAGDLTNEILQLIEALQPYFDCLILDGSAFKTALPLKIIDKSRWTFLTSSFKHDSIAALQKLEKSLLAQHFPMRSFRVLFSQTDDAQPLLKDFENWSSSLDVLATLPYQGEGFQEVLRSKTQAQLLQKRDIRAWNTKVTACLQDAEPGTTDPGPQVLRAQQVHQLHQNLLETLRQGGHLTHGAGPMDRGALEPKSREILDRLIQDFKIPDRETTHRMMEEALDLCFGFGPLAPLLQNNAITEIMVNGPHKVFIERKGLLEKSDARFIDDQQLRTTIERILAPLGRRIDESQPYVDGRLPDGSRVNAVIPPLSLNGPLLTIRKFSHQALGVQDLIRFHSITAQAGDFLGACVRARKNIIVSGGTGSGKTTLLNVLSTFIPENERIVTIEDSAELRLSQEHLIRLESRPANLEGKGQVTIRDLVINSLRMRPDRIIVGEVRGSEALDMLQAMNTGHDGSLTTGHANSPRDMLARLETMCLFSGLPLPIRAVREQIARALHLVVQQSRLPNGQRAVTRISEIQGMEGDVILLQDLFVREEKGELVHKGFAPQFIQDLEGTGYRWPGHARPS